MKLKTINLTTFTKSEHAYFRFNTVLPTDSLKNNIKPKIDTVKLTTVDSDTLVVPIPKVVNKQTKDTTTFFKKIVKPKTAPKTKLKTIRKAEVKAISNTDSITPAEHKEFMAFLTPNELFGANSTLLIPKYTTEQPPRITENRSLASNNQIAGILLFIICFYCFIIYRFIHPIRLVMKNAFTVKGTMSYLETPSHDFLKSLSYGHQLSQLALALTATTISSILIEEKQINAIIVFLTLWLALQTITLLQRMLNRWCSDVSTNYEAFSELKQLRKFNIMAFTLVYAPLAVLATFSDIMTIAALFAMVLLSFWHIYRILSYLRFKKISFLQWFLYLCTVELLPLLAVTAILTSLIRIF